MRTQVAQLLDKAMGRPPHNAMGGGNEGTASPYLAGTFTRPNVTNGYGTRYPERGAAG